MSDYQLTTKLIEKSNSKIWDIARLEWELDQIYEDENFDECLCGHSIKEVCELKNRYNGNLVVVGNCCVKKFLKLPTNKMFTAISKVKKDVARGLNVEVIIFAFDKKWINAWERDFYVDTWRKRVLSGKQEEKRLAINKKVLNKLAKQNGQEK